MRVCRKSAQGDLLHFCSCCAEKNAVEFARGELPHQVTSKTSPGPLTCILNNTTNKRPDPAGDKTQAGGTNTSVGYGQDKMPLQD